MVGDRASPSCDYSVQAVRITLGAGGVSFYLISTHIPKRRYLMLLGRYVLLVVRRPAHVINNPLTLLREDLITVTTAKPAVL